MKLIRVIQSKIVKKDNKYQVQSEKGKNLGTYDTKEQAEKRLKQVEMFKHMKSSMSASDVEKMWQNRYDVIIDKIDYEDVYMTIITDDQKEHKLTLSLDYELGSFVPETKGTSSPYLADTPEDYYGNKALPIWQASRSLPPVVSAVYTEALKPPWIFLRTWKSWHRPR